MRIDLVITELDTGGAEKCCTELAIFLKRHGHQVRVLALGPPPPSSKAALLRSLQSESIDVKFMDGRRAWMFPKVAYRLYKEIKNNKPDVIQSFLWHANVISAGIAGRLHIPLVGGIRVAEPRSSRRLLGGWAASRMKKIVCVSQEVATWCQKNECPDSNKLIVIPNGIEVDALAPTSDRLNHNVPTSARVLLFVGRLEHQKGVDILVERAPKMLEQLPSHHLVVIGDGSMKPLVQSLANISEISGRVHYLGQRDDVQQWMANAELLLLPTRYEGMPNVILEAMATGLPVVTMRVEGVADLLGSTVQLQSVPPNDWDGFFALVQSLATDQEGRNELKMANRTRARTQFELQQQLAKYESLYQSL